MTTSGDFSAGYLRRLRANWPPAAAAGRGGHARPDREQVAGAGHRPRPDPCRGGAEGGRGDRPLRAVRLRCLRSLPDALAADTRGELGDLRVCARLVAPRCSGRRQLVPGRLPMESMGADGGGGLPGGRGMPARAAGVAGRRSGAPGGGAAARDGRPAQDGAAAAAHRRALPLGRAVRPGSVVRHPVAARLHPADAGGAAHRRGGVAAVVWLPRAAAVLAVAGTVLIGLIGVVSGLQWLWSPAIRAGRAVERLHDRLLRRGAARRRDHPGCSPGWRGSRWSRSAACSPPGC